MENKSVKPWYSLLLMLMVFALLAVVVLLMPKGEFVLNDAIKIRFVSLQDVLNPRKVQYADVSKIIAREELLNADSVLGMVSGTGIADTNQVVVDSIISAKADAAALLNIDYKIQYPEGQNNLLQPFFESLDALSVQKTLIRILHYGDSQIEGDRITGTLRYKMQGKFGGCGAGIIPFFDVSDMRSSVRVIAGPNWKKFAVYGGLYKGFKNKNYGLQGAVFRPLSYEPGDTTGKAFKSATVTLQKSYSAFPNTRQFSKFNIYYGTKTGGRLSIFQGRHIWKNDSLPAANYAVKSYDIDSFKKEIKLEIPAGLQADFYGLSLDCNEGVAVDNFSMRGSSGVDFTRMDAAFFVQQAKQLNVKLIILQFGVNVVPNVLSDYSYYEKSFYRQLKYFKDNLPGVSILVIGVSDMSTKSSGGQYVSYSNVTMIRDAQRRAAFEAGCAFWDLYEAMGGENSMPGWVTATPPLAEKDFTHFNSRGARIIGEMIYNALMSEYLTYKNNAVR